jgi:hypothetical protein
MREHRHFYLEGPFNPEHEPYSSTHYRLHLKRDTEPTNKRTATTKHSQENRQNLSSANLHEVKGDAPTHFTQNLRERPSHKRTYSKNRTEGVGEEGKAGSEHFGRITMHCLRKRREVFEKDAHSLESEYTYLLKKIDKLQRDKSSEQEKAMRREGIQWRRKR